MRIALFITDFNDTLFRRRVGRFLPAVPAAVAALAPAVDGPWITLISDRSATADDPQLLKGVHGPRTLDVLVLGAGTR